MTSAIIQLLMFIGIAMIAIAIFYFHGGLTKMNLLIFTTLFSLWFTMFLYKDIPEFKSNIQKLGMWVWPIILSIYQFTQALVRIPIGIISQKLNSRKKIVQGVGLILLVAILLLIASRMSVWSIIVASFASGIFGATFGLDAQYVSENWDIKQVFRSSVIVFIIPVMGEMASKSLTGFIGIEVISNAWIYLLAISMTIGTLTIVLYSFSKENISTIKLDNMDNSKINIKHRGKLDILALSLTVSILLFMYTFVMGLGALFKIGIWAEAIIIISLLSSITVGLFLTKAIKAAWLKKISMSILVISFLILGILIVTHNINRTTWIAISIFASVGFGSYLMVLFGSALHFDHKYPALVLGIFLSFKSFMTAMAELSSSELVSSIHSDNTIGIYILISTISSFILIEIVQVYFFIKDKNGKYRTINSLVDDMSAYETENSRKIVISNKK